MENCKHSILMVTKKSGNNFLMFNNCEVLFCACSASRLILRWKYGVNPAQTLHYASVVFLYRLVMHEQAPTRCQLNSLKIHKNG